MNDKINKVLQLAEICSKFEHAGDELTKDVEYDFDSFDFEHLDKDMIVSTEQKNWVAQALDRSAPGTANMPMQFLSCFKINCFFIVYYYFNAIG